MKTSIIFCAFIVAVASDACNTNHLQIPSCKTNLHLFMYIIPTYDIIQLYRKYLINNEQNVINVFAYLKTEEFIDALDAVINVETMQPFHKDAAEYNVTIEELIDELSGRFGYDIWEETPLKAINRGDKNFHDFLEEGKVFVDSNEVMDLSIGAFYSDGLYKKWFCHYINMDKGQFLKEINEQDIVVEMLQNFAKLNVNVSEVLQYIISYFVQDDDFECY